MRSLLTYCPWERPASAHKLPNVSQLAEANAAADIVLYEEAQSGDVHGTNTSPRIFLFSFFASLDAQASSQGP